jgi:hypothetical protein
MVMVTIALTQGLPSAAPSRTAIPTIQAPHFTVIEKVRFPMATATATASSPLLTTVSSNWAGRGHGMWVASPVPPRRDETAPSSYIHAPQIVLSTAMRWWNRTALWAHTSPPGRKLSAPLLFSASTMEHPGIRNIYCKIVGICACVSTVCLDVCMYEIM